MGILPYMSCVLLTLAFTKVADTVQAADRCTRIENIFPSLLAPPAPFCPTSIAQLDNAIYLLYDVNPPEGFNLRRDVFIRLAVFVRHLQLRPGFKNVRLVLPPWRRLYHWKSNHVQQENLPWSVFFDIPSIQRYAPILDFPDFLQEIYQFGLPDAPYVPVHKTFQLMQFEEMFENGVFHDKFEFESKCHKEQHLRGYLLQQSLLLDNEFECVRFQGSVNLLERLLRHAMKNITDQPTIFAILNAEIVLHEDWGNHEFWRARRSMRFASHLVDIAADFRSTHFESTDCDDKVQRPPMWEMERPYRNAVGGAYLCAHLRRGDFVYGREKTTPTLRSAAAQMRNQLQELNLTKVFLATDATAFELKNLRTYLQRVQFVRFSVESLAQKAQIKDGGIAIVDQIICSHASYFIGTYESTFTYRIYEEREILGFPASATFNTFCKNEFLTNCSRNSKWPIVY